MFLPLGISQRGSQRNQSPESPESPVFIVRAYTKGKYKGLINTCEQNHRLDLNSAQENLNGFSEAKTRIFFYFALKLTIIVIQWIVHLNLVLFLSEAA